MAEPLGCSRSLENLMGAEEKLDMVAGIYDSSKDFDSHLIRYNFEIMRTRLKGPRVLEMGCANGVMTRMLSDHFPQVDVVDGSEIYLQDARNRLRDRRNVRYFHSLFENFEPIDPYNSIIMARALEHLEKPAEVLRPIARWLETEGELHIVVPNALSLNRRIGVAMGLIPRWHSLHDRDQQMGHRRVYDFETLRGEIEGAGFTITYLTGVFLKPLSNAQMASWDARILDALFEVGKELPEYCAEIYAVCSPRR